MKKWYQTNDLKYLDLKHNIVERYKKFLKSDKHEKNERKDTN